jgi:4-hydroxybenzoate polyprenyltransferase
MWNFLLGFLFARATGISRIVRPLLLLALFGAIIAGIIYSAVQFKALKERTHSPHVHAHSTH